jgi:hypothetical protein
LRSALTFMLWGASGTIALSSSPSGLPGLYQFRRDALLYAPRLFFVQARFHQLITGEAYLEPHARFCAVRQVDGLDADSLQIIHSDQRSLQHGHQDVIHSAPR